jgi:hypothetical protein
MYLFNLLEFSFWVLFTIDFTRLIDFSLVPVIWISMFFLNEVLETDFADSVLMSFK